MIKKDFLHILKLCKKLKPEEFNSFLDHLSDNSVDSICECVYNVINTDLKLSSAKRRKLKNHIVSKCNTKNIKLITNKKVSISKRRKLIKQEGGFLGPILAAVIPFLTSLFTPKS